MDAQPTWLILGSKSCQFSLDKGDGSPPPPLDACVLRAPHPTIYTLRWLLQRFLHKQLHCKEQRDCRWRREEGSAPGGVPVSWVTGPGTGRTAPLPNDWLPSKAEGGKFLTAGSVSAGSCHWHLISERWADHGLGEVRATPRKDTILFRANWTRILRDGVYVVEDEGKYHGFVVGQTLSRPGALRVKCEDNAQRHQQSAVPAVLAERERTPTSQLRQALAAIKENVDTRVRVCPPASMSTWPIGPKNAHCWRAGALFRRRSKQLVLATFQAVNKKRLKNLLNVAGTAFWNVAGTLILAILHVGGGHPDQPVGPARRSGDPSLARKRSTAHLFGYAASAVAVAARRRARVPHGHDGLRGNPRQRSRDTHCGVGQHWRPVPSAAAHCQKVAAEPPPPPPACAPPVQPQPPNPRLAPQTAPKPKPKPQRPPKREPKSAPKPPPQKRKRLPEESSSEESSSDSSTDSSSGSTTDSSAFGEPQPRPPAKEPTKPPRKAPKRAAPPQPKSKAKPKARGGGVQIQSGGASVCSFLGQWGVGD